MIILPGRTEFIEKYYEAISELMARRFAVGILDWRGQGLSDRPLADPLRGHIASFSIYVEDLNAILADAFADLPGRRLLLCHSMGANIAAHALSVGDLKPIGAIFTVPMLGVLTPGYPYLLARALTFGACAIGLGKSYVPGGSGASILNESFATQLVTHDAVRFARAQALVAKEPRLALGSPTFAWLNAAFVSIAQLTRPGVPEAIRTPSLFLLAEEEAITDNRPVEGFARRMPRCRLVRLEARHELLMEKDVVRAAFWREYDTFVADLLGRDNNGGVAS